MSQRFIFAVLAAAGLVASTGCCGGPCGNACGWYPGKNVFQNIGCRSGCGGLYWNEFYNDPPDPYDPCDCQGGFTGRSCGCGGWGDSGSSCGCGGGAPAGEGDVYYEDGPPAPTRPRYVPTPATANRKPSQRVSQRPAARRIQPVSHTETTNRSGELAAEQILTAPTGPACTTCRR